jgi:hypothetical protein
MSPPRRAVPDVAGFVVGKHERPHLGEGWWDRMGWPDRPGLICRTAHTRAEFFLRGRPGCTGVTLLLAASLTLIGGPAEVEVLMAREGEEPAPVGKIRIAWEDWAVHAVACPVHQPAPLTFVLHTLTPAIPHRVLKNGDHRRLGVHLAAARLA